ncbi:NADH ubiquinone oxidoreductase subunit NDUFA12 domain-containing protein [Ditylenchus destructor]|uniref:NADH dehydrogenase [ubiquinone] 1 alpha subcomplex subunit 12 n=1 Tax=Ditylenchus destructor TaxID=166010 RepID=A0AAD4NIY1_9BILA|nr:NADH ubiquinone oxidoreductase subunit NDUFA12 domain-containing protein [Ditylenchus destructor]
MPPTLKEYFMLDKIGKFFGNIKKIGGVRAAIKQRYLMDQTRAGTLVGTDKFGNKYYEDNSYYMPRNRYVVYPDRVWLDYDGSQVPPEWHRWLHHTADKTPIEEPPVQHKWMLEHQENKSLSLADKYVPYSTTRTKVQGWEPGQKQGSEV